MGIMCYAKSGSAGNVTRQWVLSQLGAVRSVPGGNCLAVGDSGG
jgi:hypothetical protein